MCLSKHFLSHLYTPLEAEMSQIVTVFFNSYTRMLRKHVVNVKVPLQAKCIRWEAFKFNDMFIDCCVYKKNTAEKTVFPIVVNSIVIVVDVKVSFLLLVHVRRVYNNVGKFYIHKSRTYLLSYSYSSRCFSGWWKFSGLGWKWFVLTVWRCYKEKMEMFLRLWMWFCWNGCKQLNL